MQIYKQDKNTVKINKMEDQKKLDNKEIKIDKVEEKNNTLNYRLKSCIFGLKNVIEGNLDESKINNQQYLDEQEGLDNTNQRVVFEKLKLNPRKN